MTSVLLLLSSCEWRQTATRWHHLLTSYNQLSPTGDLKFWIKEFSLPFPIYYYFLIIIFYSYAQNSVFQSFSRCEPIITREQRLDFCRIKPLFLIFPHRLNSQFSPVTSSYITSNLKTVTYDCLIKRALETKLKKTCLFQSAFFSKLVYSHKAPTRQDLACIHLCRSVQ